MKCRMFVASLFGAGLALGVASALNAQTKQDQTIRESISVFQEIMVIPGNSIPQGLLKDAHGVAIIPSVLKGGFVVGARFGNGVLLVRDDNGGWHAPVFMSLTGGNIGWQVGVQSTDVVLVFKTRQSVNGLLTGKFTLGADAAVAAGPLGRQASAGTDGRLSAEIYSYSRSRGLFAGVSFDGSVIQIDALANAAYYRPSVPGGPVIVPPEAQQLVMSVMQYTGGNLPGGVPIEPQNQAPLAQQYSKDEATHVRDELARVAPPLYQLLDANWQHYLAIPAEVFQGKGHPPVEILNESLAHFETVRTDSRYVVLAARPEFQSTYALLKHYVQELTQADQPLNLPAPPVAPFSSR